MAKDHPYLLLRIHGSICILQEGLNGTVWVEWTLVNLKT